MMARMRARVALVCVLGLSGLLLAQEEKESSFHLDLDPLNLVKEVDRVQTLFDAGSFEDGVTLADRLLRDPRLREGFLETSTGSFATLDRVLRSKLLRLPEAAQRAYDARCEEEAARLEDQGTTR